MYFCLDTLSAFLLFLFLHQTCLSQLQPAAVLNGRRDGSLKALAALLNKNTDLFKAWSGGEDDYVKFIKILEPWLLSPPPSPKAGVSSLLSLPPLPSVDCKQPRYSQTLTGRDNQTPRVIIDFIPFGYDVDKLEIRLHELNEVVDLFFIYESPRTLSGMRKTCYYYEKLVNDERFKKFQSKIVHTIASEEELRQHTQKVRTDLRMNKQDERPGNVRSQQQQRQQQQPRSLTNLRKRQHRLKVPKGGNGHWALDTAMRFEMVKHFNALLSEVILSNSTLVSENMIVHRPPPLQHLSPTLLVKIKAGIDDGTALGLQNDADEIPTAIVLKHLRHCEIKPHFEFIYLPCISYKKNYYWLQTTFDLGCLSGPDVTPETESVKHYLWRPAPWVWPLQTILQEENTLRHYKTDGHECKTHMGLGAASHMSSGAEPVEYWHKRGGVNEQSFKGAVSNELVEAGKIGKITPELIFHVTIHPWCRAENPSKHISALPKEVQTIMWNSVPRLIRAYPERYPFFVPGLALSAKGSSDDEDLVGIIAKCAEASWGNLCTLRNSTSF